jgi:hypothetical protein
METSGQVQGPTAVPPVKETLYLMDRRGGGKQIKKETKKTPGRKERKKERSESL